VIHGFERELGLKARFGRRVQVAGGLQRPFAFELGAMTLEAQCSAARSNHPGSEARLAAVLRAQDLRAPALKLAAWERNPFIRNNI
jgi:hypothetical protein